MQVARLKAVIAALVVLITAVWVLSARPGSFTGGFWPARSALVYYTGFLAIGFLSVGVVLAARPVQVEGVLGGLDKFYRLHKWLGIAGTLLAVAHWLAENAPRWMVQWGWLARRQRPAAAALAATGFDPFRDLRGLAVGFGEWGFYLLLAAFPKTISSRKCSR